MTPTGAADGRPRPDRTQGRLIVATVLAYAVGYPLALVGGWAVGWILVTLGGFLLMGLGLVTIRRIQRAGPSEPTDRSDG